MSNKILVPTDFSPMGDSAVQHAIRMAKRGNHQVIILHVLDDKDQSKIKKGSLTEEDIRQQLKQQATKAAAAGGITTDYILRRGTIFETIGKVARETQCWIVVMGTHGVVGLKQKLFGARALKVAESTSEPMIIVQSKHIGDNGYQKIVFPIDHDKNMDGRIMETINVGRLFGAEVHLLKELEMVDTLTERINMNYHHACQQLGKAGLTCVDGHVNPEVRGFGKQILKYASDIGADLITIKNHMDSHPEEYIYGFDEEEIINNEDEIAVLWMN